MKIFLVIVISFYSFFPAQSQVIVKARKYPSLLWEITGNGLKKPSHLIGTMHVSSKLAFNLPDSFYLAIRNAEVVALESNPETWQEDMSRYDLNESDNPDNSAYSMYMAVPNEYLSIRTLKFFKYDKKIETALYSNPTTINNLLYRSYGNENSDFEEDTYLDMYIFQCGKKWSKKLTGVENYGESMKLMAEAYRDAAKDKNIRRRSYTGADNDYSEDKLEEAYRTGNLDLLDSINRYNSISDAFDEKFLYKRNEIQANSIDSILKSGTSLFVGVGAAHLPGERGVIEILRRKGYKLRPVKMGERASREKDLVDKIRVPVVFHTETVPDRMFSVDIPGKFYQFGDDASLDQRQYADMSNGSYYMVTRIMTNSWMWNQKPTDVYRVVDSLLYENIPGKIISKTTVQKNGYKGFDIINRTRRGDIQRYNIFITPFEVLVFKMSGNGEYVKNGPEAARFFGSIRLKEFTGVNVTNGWKKFSPSYGGFSVNLPHEPYTGNDGSWIFDASDPVSGEHYRVMRTDIHNYHFVGEDSFDLGLMDESFGASEFIDRQLYRQQGRFKGYPSLDTRYADKSGNVYVVRFILEGPHYYTLIAHGKKESPAMTGFLNSFQLQPYIYGMARELKDSSLYFTVKTPVYPVADKIKLGIPYYTYGYGETEDLGEDEQLESGAFRNRIIANDSTGEKVFVSFFRSSRYYYSKDSVAWEKDNEESVFGTDSTWIVRKNKKLNLPGNIRSRELILSDTSSSRALWGKSFYRDGVGFSIVTQVDTLTTPSAFIKTFFETFTPSDTVKGINPFEKKSALFFADFRSHDSLIHKRAVKSIDEIDLDSADFGNLEEAISSLNWHEKKYLDTKTSLINKLGMITTRQSADYLKHLYYDLDDTIELQYAVLENLLQHKTDYAYGVFRDIIKTEPPVLQTTTPSYTDYMDSYSVEGYDNGKFFDELSDSLALTKKILPDLLQLLNLQDYKSSMLKLLGELVDSNLISTKDYDSYIPRFLLEARQELKKQAIAEKKKAIQKAEEDKDGKKNPYSDYYDTGRDAGNADLSLYASILLPFWDKDPAVKTLIQQMLRSGDKRLRYNTMILLEKNKKPYPDSLLAYFASLDEYRYELYTDLRKAGSLNKFPAKYNNHRDLGISVLLDQKLYGKPDSVIYLDRLKTIYRDKTGYLYFYRYKDKKDDLTWKLAVVGLLPEDPGSFEIEDNTVTVTPAYLSSVYTQYSKSRYSFTDFTGIKFSGEEPLETQLKRLQKRLLYSRKKSGKLFYEEEKETTSYID